jgi:hypothetical protein
MRVVALLGPTAAGKTELAAELAVRLGGEVVSVDSRQVYRRLDIGTAKPDAATRARVTHHLLDLVEPDEPFDAATYARLGRSAIAAMADRGRPVVLCGGSGLYFRVLTEGLFAGPPPDPEVRRELDVELERAGAIAMHAELRRVDPRAAERIAPRDAVRIAAPEVVRQTGRPISDWQEGHGFADRPYGSSCSCSPQRSRSSTVGFDQRRDVAWRPRRDAQVPGRADGSCKPLAPDRLSRGPGAFRGTLAPDGRSLRSPSRPVGTRSGSAPGSSDRGGALADRRRARTPSSPRPPSFSRRRPRSETRARERRAPALRRESPVGAARPRSISFKNAAYA